MAPGLMLVVLAGGIGRRYGSDKQTASVGPGGEWLLEYTLHDAIAAGFSSILMVIRPSLRETLQQRLGPMLDERADWQLIEQSADKLPAGFRPDPGRSKPLGTGHALWCCKSRLHGPFAVVNADDYYGADAFCLLAEHFHDADGPAMVGYRLDQGLSPHGGVNRGVCDVDGSGYLRGVREYTGIHEQHGVLRGLSPDGVETSLAPETIVSLNCWGLVPDFLPDLEAGLATFLRHAGADDEFFLPHAIDRYLARSGHRLAVLQGKDEWLGLTWPQDRSHVMERLAAMHAAGRYPTPLWSQA